jgi:hypothetical protein
LFGDAVSNPESPYKIQWMTPYSLVYAILGFSWVTVGPEHAGRLGMLLLALMWIVLVHTLASKRERPSYGAVLVTAFFFCHIMYWGFYQFCLGWIVFLGWILLTQTQRKKLYQETFLFLVGAAILYFAHVLWFFVALAWLVVGDVLFRRQWKTLIARICGTIPVLVLVILWYPSLAAYGFTSGTHWLNTPLERLSLSWLVESALGGLKGSVEYVFVGVILFLVILVLVQYRKDIRKNLDFELLLLGLGFFILGLLLPDKHTNTIQFAQRWIPPAVSLIILSLPPLRFKALFVRLGAIAVVAGFMLTTSISWMMFESTDLSGLPESLKALPENPRVIGLNYIPRSPIIRGRPMIQVFAYSQVYRGGELNFSLADFGPSLVVYRKRRYKPWTAGLEWFPERVRVKDFQYFDYALINGSDELHAQLAGLALLEPVTNQARWRLYRINMD